GWHIKHGDAQAAKPQTIERACTNAERIRHDPRPLDAHRVQPQQYAADDVRFFVVVEDGAVSDQAANVLARRRIGDDADGTHAAGIISLRKSTTRRDTSRNAWLPGMTQSKWPTPGTSSRRRGKPARSNRCRASSGATSRSAWPCTSSTGRGAM